VFLQLDGTLFVQIVNFIAFVVLLNLVFLRPVGRAIAKRRAYIDSIGRDVEAADNEIRTARATAEDQRLSARSAADAILAKARAAAQTEAAAILADFSERAAEKVKGAQQRVDEEVAQARTREPEIVASLAETMLERAIGEAVR